LYSPPFLLLSRSMPDIARSHLARIKEGRGSITHHTHTHTPHTFPAKLVEMAESYEIKYRGFLGSFLCPNADATHTTDDTQHTFYGGMASDSGGGDPVAIAITCRNPTRCNIVSTTA
jgi:hypothetical protein